MENYDKVLEYTTESMNSAGSASEKYEAYLDSLDAKVNQFTATWEQLVINMNKSDLYAGFVEFGTNAIEVLDVLINDLHLLDAGLATMKFAGLTAVGSQLQDIVTGVQKAANIFNTIQLGGSGLSALDSGVTSLSKGMQYLNAIMVGFDKTSNTFNSDLIDAAFKAMNYSDAMIDAAKKTTTFKVAQAAATVATKTHTAASAVATASTGGLGAAFSAAAVQAKALGSAITGALAANPILTGVIAVGLLVAAFQKVAQAAEEARQEAIQTAQDIATNYETAKSNIDSNISTISGLENEYNELAKGVDSFGNNLTLTADEYDRYKEIVEEVNGMIPDTLRGYADENGLLQDKNRLLQDMNELLEQQAKIEAQLATSGQTGEDYLAGTIETYKEGMRGVLDMSKGTSIFNALDDAIKEATPKQTNILGDFTTVVDERKTRQQVVDALGSIFSDVDVAEIFDKYVQTGYTNPDMFTFLEDNAEYIDENIDEIINSLSGMDIEPESLENIISALRNFDSDFDNYTTQVENSAAAFKQFWYDWMDGWTNYGDLGTGAQQIVQDYIDNFDPIVMETKYLREETEDELTALINSFTNKLGDGRTVSEALGDLSNLKLELPADEWLKQYEDTMASIQKAAGWGDEQTLQIKAKLGFDIDVDRVENLKDIVQNAFNLSDIDVGTLTIEQLEYAAENTGSAALRAASNVDEFRNVIYLLNQDVDSLTSAMQTSMSALSEEMDGFRTLSSLVEEYNSTGYMTIDTLEQLLSLEDDQLQYLQFENGQLSLNTEAMKAAVKARLEEVKAKAANALMTNLEQQAEALSIDTKKQGCEESGELVTQLGDEADAKRDSAAASLELAEANLANAKAEALAGGLTEAEIQERLAPLQKVETDLRTSIAGIQDTINNLDFSFGSQLGGSEVSDATDAWKAEFDEYYDELQYLRDMDILSEAQYYQELDRLNQKYFAGREEYLDEYRQYQVEVYQGLKKLREEQQKEEEEAEKEALQNKIDRVDAQIDALQAQKEALREKNEQAELELELQKAKDRYDAAKNTRNVRKYTEERCDKKLIT